MYFNSNQCVLILSVVVGLTNCVSIEQDLTVTQKEKQALDKFREKVEPLLYQDFMKTDIYLMRWLRAKKFNLKDAEAFLKQNLKWRKENKIDTIQSEDFKDMFQEFPMSLDTYDKQGRPIGALDMNLWDLRKAALSGKGSKFTRYLDMIFNNLTMQVYERQSKGMKVTQWKALVNAEGTNVITHACPVCIPFLIPILDAFERNFPGETDEIIIIEAPTALHSIIRVLRPLMSQGLRDGLRIFGPDKQKWMRYLDEHISREERRSSYGGTNSPVERY